MNTTFQRWTLKKKKKILCHIDASCSRVTLAEKQTYKHRWRCGLYGNPYGLA